MKKIIAILLLCASGIAMADSVSLVYGLVQPEVYPGSQLHESAFGYKFNITEKPAATYKDGYKPYANSYLTGDVKVIQAQVDNTYTFATRIESGLTEWYDIGGVTLSTRVALGEKTNSSAQFNYWLVEPGVSKQIGPWNLYVGYRLRSPFTEQSSGPLHDRTKTSRFGIFYALNKTNSVALLYDSIRGDSNQNNPSIGYVHAF